MHARGIVESFRCAFQGLRFVIRTQRNARIQLCVGVAAAAVALWLGLSPAQWALFILAAGFVIVCEMANTTIEVLVDLVSPEYSPLAKAAKDAAAGAVLLSSIVSVAVGLLVLGPPLWDKLGGP